MWFGSAAAQPAPAASDTLTPYLRFDRISGMAKGAVKAIAQDGAGFMWFGTDDGLSRYDGYEFVNYVAGREQTNTLTNFTVTSLAASGDSLFIGTAKGLERLTFATHKFSRVETQSGDHIVSLHLGKSGLLWIGTADAGVSSLDPASGRSIQYRANENQKDTLSDDSIAAVYEAKDGKVWIGTRESGLDLLDPQTGSVSHFVNDPDQATSLSSDKITALYEDNAGTLWIGTENGLNLFDKTSKTFKHYFDGAEAWITTIVEGADGGLWLGIKGIGVYRFDRTTKTVEKYRHDGGDPTSISNPLTWCAFSDRGGVLWFGADAGGVSKLALNRRQFTFYRTNPGLSFLEAGDEVWLGTQGRGLRLFNVKTGTVKSFLDEQLNATWTTKIVPGANNSLWIGTTDQGLLHFTPKTGVLETYDRSSGTLAADSVLALLPDGDTLWIGTFGGGLARYDLAKGTVAYSTSQDNNPQSLTSDDITVVHQDHTRANVLWVGTASGLNKYDKGTGQVVRYFHDPAKATTISHNHVTHIHEDRKGRMWIATWGGGLNLLDRKTDAFTAYHASGGLASDTVYGILEDKAGALWLTTSDGLTRFDPEKATSTNYRAGDGLQEDEFGQGGFHQGASGRFYVGGPRGFNVFVPEELKTDNYLPPVVLTKFEVVGESRAIPESVSLSFRDRWFAVTFAGLAYASPSRNRYRFRLAGFDDWIEGDRRFVSYSSLPPGNYTLEIQASNAQGVWNQDGIKLPVHVSPPPWRTWWAYTSYVILVLVIIALFIRRERKKLKAIQQAHRLTELEREIELTSAVQEGFFPSEPSVNENQFRLEGFYRAASQCSGDWWWYERRHDSYFILVGDVTGHGAGSAMVTAAAASCFRSLGMRVDDDTRLEEMNEEVLRVSRQQYHMTLTAVDVNLTTGKYVIRSAGGLPVFSLPPQGRTRVLMCPGMPLGSPEFEIGRVEGKLVPGERLMILTDGIPEVALTNQQLLGPRGVSNFYLQTRDRDLRSALSELVKKVEAVQTGAQDDDWTVVMLQWRSAGQLEPQFSDPDTVTTTALR